MIQLRSPREIELMAQGGAILGATLKTLRKAVRPGISTLELDEVGEQFIRGHDGATPAFKGLYGFPGSVCISVNEEIVHGIPSKKRILKEGDIVSLDVGVGYKGFFTDAAITVPVGEELDEESKRLLKVTEESLKAGIEAAQAGGSHVGDTSAPPYRRWWSAPKFTVVRDLVGHGVGAAMHEEPQVPNFGKPHRGAKLSLALPSPSNRW